MSPLELCIVLEAVLIAALGVWLYRLDRSLVALAQIRDLDAQATCQVRDRCFALEERLTRSRAEDRREREEILRRLERAGGVA